MILGGAILAFSYDFLRIHRRLKYVPDFLVNLEDFIFAAMSAVLVFYITYMKNNGEIRWQTAAGFILGAGLYILIIRDRWVKAVCFIYTKTVRITKKILKIMLYPLVIVLKLLLKPCKVVFWYSGRGVSRIKRRAKIQVARAKIKMKHMGYIMRKK